MADRKSNNNLHTSSPKRSGYSPAPKSSTYRSKTDIDTYKRNNPNRKVADNCVNKSQSTHKHPKQGLHKFNKNVNSGLPQRDFGNMQTFYTSDGRWILVKTEPIGSGNEAFIYEIVDAEQGESDYCTSDYLKNAVAKIYKPVHVFADNHFDKLTAIIQLYHELKGQGMKISSMKTSHPLILLYDSDPVKSPGTARIKGFAMPKVKGKDLSIMLLNEAMKRNRWNRLDLTSLSLKILEAIKTIHKQGILLGDIRLANIMVTINDNKQSGSVSFKFVDMDSCQVGYHDGASWVGTDRPYGGCTFDPEYTSTRLLREDFSKGLTIRTLDDELYAIAVLIFKILMCASSPYICRDYKNAEQRINDRQFHYPEGYVDDPLQPVGVYYTWWCSLSPDIQNHFRRVFERKETVSVDEWMVVLDDYRNNLRIGKYPRDIYSNIKDYFIERSKALMRINPSVPSTHKRFWTVAPTRLSLSKSAKKSTTLALLFFGTNRLRGYYRGDISQRISKDISTWSPEIFQETPLWSGDHFDMVNHYGILNLPKFADAIEGVPPKGRGVYFPKWLGVLKREEPAIDKFYAFAGSALRCLENRDIINNYFQENYGFKFHILSAEDEARLILTALNDNIQDGTALLNISGMSTSLVVFMKNSIAVVEPCDMGGRLLRNWVFSSIHPDIPIEHALTMHEEALTRKCTIFDNIINDIGALYICGIKSLGNRECTFAELDQIKALYKRELCENRYHLKDLPKDLENCLHNLPDQLDVFLRFPMIQYIVQKANLEKVKFLNYGIEQAILHNKKFKDIPLYELQQYISEQWNRINLNEPSLCSSFIVLKEIWDNINPNSASSIRTLNDTYRSVWFKTINSELCHMREFKFLSYTIAKFKTFLYKCQNTSVSDKDTINEGFTERKYKQILYTLSIYMSEMSNLEIPQHIRTFCETQ